MNTNELLDYYANLLIIQYRNKPKAYGTMRAIAGLYSMVQTTVQTVTLSTPPDSGQLVLSYGDDESPALDWDDSESEIQTKLRTIPGLSAITVSGSFSAGPITVTFTGVLAPAAILSVFSSTLEDGPDFVSVTISETDQTLPLAVQNGYNLSGSSPAIGLQLDVLGKYIGVSRYGYSLTGAPLALNDADYLQFLRIGVASNSLGASLKEIDDFLQDFFPNQVLLYDYQNMNMAYAIDSSFGSTDLLQMLVTQGRLPKPMGVGISVIVFIPDIFNIFGMSTYEQDAENVSPFNTYEDYQTDWPWLEYQNVLDT